MSKENLGNTQRVERVNEAPPNEPPADSGVAADPWSQAVADAREVAVQRQAPPVPIEEVPQPVRNLVKLMAENPDEARILPRPEPLERCRGLFSAAVKADAPKFGVTVSGVSDLTGKTAWPRDGKGEPPFIRVRLGEKRGAKTAEAPPAEGASAPSPDNANG